MLTKTGSWHNQDEFYNYGKPLRTKDNFFEEERIIIFAFPGFEPAHLCDPSD